MRANGGELQQRDWKIEARKSKKIKWPKAKIKNEEKNIIGRTGGHLGRKASYF